ncbi:MAG: hypothetical protein JOZ77_05690 [Candidatus Eremiobacteraeota bacterium]|nr:hypothetical protein [Candidatus Eremiobacteraeota bacterium]
MIKYLLLSTLIVLGVAVVVAGWTNRDLIRVKLASVYARVPAKTGDGGEPIRKVAAPLRGDAPWALSALPECLLQTSESHGPLAYLRGHLPAGAVPILPPATLVYGDCSISIAGDEAYVRRGADRLRIPPRARFYRAAASLALIRVSPEGDELRIYQPAKQ